MSYDEIWEELIDELTRIKIESLTRTLATTRTMTQDEKDRYIPVFFVLIEDTKSTLVEFNTTLDPTVRGLLRRIHRELGIPFTLGDF